MKNGPYEMIVAPEGYPGKKYRGRYAYEHIVVWWQFHGQVPPKGYEIHHKDMNHRNNKPDNLMLVSCSEHRKLHGRLRHEKSRKELICPWCKKQFFLKGNAARSRIKQNINNNLYCSRSCASKFQFRGSTIGSFAHGC